MIAEGCRGWQGEGEEQGTSNREQGAGRQGRGWGDERTRKRGPLSAPRTADGGQRSGPTGNGRPTGKRPTGKRRPAPTLPANRRSIGRQTGYTSPTAAGGDVSCVPSPIPRAHLHRIRRGKIDLSRALFGQCFNVQGWETDHRLINQVMSDAWADFYCGPGYSCQYTLYNYSCPGGICHYGNSHQILRQSHMETFGLQIHVVNHETGHAFGFDDGTPGDCSPPSIMHSAAYGCTNHYWPTQQDRDVLTYLAAVYSY